MKTEQPILITSTEAKVNLAKNLFVGFDGLVCGNGAKALGVCNAETDLGEIAPVMSVGIALVLSGAAIAVGAKIQSNASGKAITFAAGEPNGFALNAATGADELIRVKLV
ncbi:MAG: DUF2190 domain-containing protein [Ignavibacteriales bacterium UTCHB2]|jgi:hypothetical protein|nr:MAG: DUF2190 domain-containing protein [Ignavibacteriales bacterium UTCHB2]